MFVTVSDLPFTGRHVPASGGQRGGSRFANTRSMLLANHFRFTRLSVTVASLAAIAGTAFVAKPASACSCASDIGFYATFPKDGAEDVPTNVALLVSTAYSSKVTLLDEEDNEVEFSTSPVHGLGGFCTSSSEFLPNSELLPNHTYRLVAALVGEDQTADNLPTTVTFTTGDGPTSGDAEAPAPAVKLAVFDATKYQNTCIYGPIQGCLVSDTDELLEVLYERDGKVVRYVGSANDVKHLEFAEPDGEVCVSIHSRDLAGNLSKPFEKCFDTNNALELAYDEGAGIYPDCANEQIVALLNGETRSDSKPPEAETEPAVVDKPEDEANCSVALSNHGPSSVTLGSAFAAIAVVLRRRNRARRK